MLTRWLWRLLAVLTVALLGLLVVSGPVSASQSHHAATFPAYAYDHPDGSEILTGATTERGPPTPDDRDTTYVADDQSSSGASAHSDEPKSADGIGYDRSEVLVQLARPTATTAAPSFAFHCSRVAANTGRTAARACSFAGATTVLMADGLRKPIEDVEVGDEVIATDPETGEQVAKTVEYVFVHDDTVVDLGVNGEVIATTEDHPFWSVTDQRFERADELSPGEKVLGVDGTVITLAGLELGTARETLAYNLSVEGIHTYHVGNAEILVHNESTCGRALWQITDAKSLTTKVVGEHKYSKQADGTWWSRDTAGHGESAWKVYREIPGGLKWYRDADKYGTYIDPALKHKSDVGMIVRW